MQIKTLNKFWQWRFHRKPSLHNASFSWCVMLGALAVIFIMLIIWSYYVSLSVKRADLFERSEEAAKHLDVLDEKELAAIFSFYDKRQERFGALKNTKPELIDPSL